MHRFQIYDLDIFGDHFSANHMLALLPLGLWGAHTSGKLTIIY